VRRLLFRTIHDVALMLDREREGREQSPSAAVVDSHSVKAPSAPSGGGYDAGKRIKGRKRHIAVDTDGRWRREIADVWLTGSRNGDPGGSVLSTIATYCCPNPASR